jgi:hypothetical protein
MRKIVFISILLCGLQLAVIAEPVRGWLEWRGPNQNGTSPETGLPERLKLAERMSCGRIRSAVVALR